VARRQNRIYLFNEGKAEMRMLLGNKGANLAEMTNLGLPVPPGFTITTEVCREYYRNGGKLPEGLMDEVRRYMARVEKKVGRKFGDPENPLLVSVRSGAPASMPRWSRRCCGNFTLSDTTNCRCGKPFGFSGRHPASTLTTTT